VLEAAVDRLGRSVGCAGPVEVGQHVDGPILERPAQGDDLGQQLGHSAADRVDQLDHQPLSFIVWLSGVRWRRCRCHRADYAGWV